MGSNWPWSNRRAARVKSSRRGTRVRCPLNVRSAVCTARDCWERDTAPTAQFLIDVLGFTRLGQEGSWTRYGFPQAIGFVDIQEMPNARRGGWGVGSVHHLAWRVDDEAHQQRVRRDVESGGAQPTPVIDRFWFKSVYFKEPGGVLFEIATDGPGFTVDEELGHLGEALVLPPFLEHHRREIEAVLPPLKLPMPATQGS